MDSTPALRTQFRFVAQAIFVLQMAAALYVVRLGERALWSEELRWAQIPREMLQTGDYFHPTINGHSYYDKPLGSYWSVLLFAGSGDVTEWSARFPCAVAGLVSILFVMLIAQRIYNQVTAVFAGAVFATSFSIVFFSRNASADMENVVGILAVFWLYLRWEEQPPGWRTIILCAMMSVTSLMKGLLGFAIPLLVIFVYRSFGPMQLRELVGRQCWLLNRWTLVAAAMSAILYLTPFYISYSRTGVNDGLVMVFRENLRRFFDPVNHRGPIWLYFAAIFPLLAPWSALLPAALCHAHSLWSFDDNKRRFPLIYFWSTFIFFTLSASRRSYYLLPVLPAAAMLIARLLEEPKACHILAVRRLAVAGVSVVAVALLAIVAAILLPVQLRPSPWNDWPEAPFRIDLLIVAAIATVLSCLELFSKRELRLGRIMVVLSGAISVAVFLIALPQIEPYRTRRPFAEAVRQCLANDFRGLALYRHREIVYYLAAAEPLPEFETMGTLADAIGKETVRRVILRGVDIADLPFRSKVVFEETTWPWESAEQRRAKLALVEFVRE